MRALRVVGLVVAVALSGVLGGCATAGAEPSVFPGPPAPAAAPVEPAPVPALAPPATTSATPTPTAPPAVAVAVAKPAAKPAPAGLASGTPCKATVAACVKLSTRQAWLVEDGKAVYGPVPITSGRAGWRTPPGMFAVTFKNINHKSRLFNNAPMPYSVFFNGGIAFHQGSLSQTSHGCIHLSKAAAQTFFRSLSRGEPVQVVA